MEKTSETISELDSIVTESGRVFRPHHKDILDSLPKDIVAQLAERRLQELEQNSINSKPLVTAKQ